MSKAELPELKFIQVQPPKDEIHFTLITNGNDNSVKQKFNTDSEKFDVYPVYPSLDNTRSVSFCDVEVRISNRIEEMFLAREIKVRDKKEQLLEGKKANNKSAKVYKGKEKKRKESRSRAFKNKVLPIDSDTELELNAKHQADDSRRNFGAVGKKKNKKPKQKERKENKPKDEMIKGEMSHIEVEVSKKQRNVPCLFGFIGQWLAKRRENRREKERKALDDVFTSVSGLCCDNEHSRDGLNVDDVGINMF